MRATKSVGNVVLALVVLLGATLAWTGTVSAGALYTTYGAFQIGDYGDNSGSYVPAGASWVNNQEAAGFGAYNNNYDCYSYGTAGSAEWTWSGLTQGSQYDVYASWSYSGNRTTNAQYTINGATPVSVNQQNSATSAYYHLLMDQPTAPFALLGTATVGKDGKVDVVLSNTVSNQYLMADAVAIRPGPVRIIDDSFAGFSGNNVAHYYGENYYYDVSHVPGYTTPTPGTGYALDSTSSAQWAFTGLADGTYKVYATWASSGTIQSNGQTSVPWSIVGTSLGGNVDQRNGPYRDSLSGDLQSVDAPIGNCWP